MKKSETWETLRYFKAEEFDSPDAKGSHVHFNVHTAHKIDRIRHRVNRPLVLNSAARTEVRNRGVGGKPKSAHLWTPERKACATDIRCYTSHMRMQIVRAAIEEGFARIGIGKTFIHLDDDETKPQEVIWLY